MYPLHVILIGRDENALSHLRRELANQAARIEAEFPDVAAAVTAVGEAREPVRLLVMHIGPSTDLAHLKRLSGTFVGWPIIAALDAGVGATEFLAAVRNGATQLVTLPLQPEDLKAALDCIALQFSHAATDSKVIAVTGVAGGCGATTIAINLAAEMAHLHKRHCVLMELSLQIGVVATCLNKTPEFTTQDLLAYDSELDAHVVRQALTPVAENFDLLAGPHHAIASGAGTPTDVLRLIGFTRLLADVLILDVPCTYDEPYFQTLAAADEIVLIMDQRIPSIRNLDLILDSLKRDAPTLPRHLVLNRYDPSLKGFTAVELAKFLKVPHLETIANDSACMTAAVNAGLSLRLQAPRSPALADLRALVLTLLHLEGSSAPVAPGMFHRLMHALSMT